MTTTNDPAIEGLARVLDAAKKGELEGFTLVAMRKNGDVMHTGFFEGEEHRLMEMVGHLHVAISRNTSILVKTGDYAARNLNIEVPMPGGSDAH